jgi:hypothetical protein
MRQLITFAACAAALSAQVTVTEEMFHGRHAWVLSNGDIRVSVLSGGGHIGEIRLISGDPKKSINPMRIPHYQTIDPQTFDPAKHAAIYGNEPHKWLSAGYMGHMLCFPLYGPPSGDEVKAGLGSHGEAPVVEWRRTKAASDVSFSYAADLPKTQYRVERAIHLAPGARSVRVEEWIENLTHYDRPYNLMEHATFGPPFVEPGKTVLDASATRGLAGKDASGTGSIQSGSSVTWPNGTGGDGKPVDLRRFQPKPHSGTYYVMRMDPTRKEQFFTLYHPEYRVLIGYVFPSDGNPWIADWQENRRADFIPWSGGVVARGIEFGTSPFDEGLRKSVERGSLFDTPAYRWIGARQKVKSEFTVFLAEIPEGFQGVKDVTMANGIPKVVSK